MLDSEHDRKLHSRLCGSSLTTDPQQHSVSDNRTLDQYGTWDSFECDQCGKSFTLKENLVSHIELKHVNVKPPPETIGSAEFFCQLCNRSFAQKWHLSRHIHHVHSDRRFVCTECGKLMSRSDVLTRHMRREHPAASQSPTPSCKDSSCHNCGEMLDSEHDRKLHSRVCGSSLATDPQQHSVSDNRTLDQNGTWNSFECDQCGKSFTLKENLVAHIELKHVNVKPPSGTTGPARLCCQLCNHSFAKKQHLSRHLRHVHSDLRFVCTVCGKHLSRADCLKRHMRREHPSQVPAAQLPTPLRED